MSDDAFDDAVASVGDFAASLLTSSPGPARSRPDATQALSTIVMAVAEARGRLPGDEDILGDLDRARASWVRAVAEDVMDLAPLGPALDRIRELALERVASTPVRPVLPPSPPAPLSASRGTPAVHHDVRLDAAPLPAPERLFGALPPRPRPAGATPAQRALRRWARDALEELAVAGRLRTPREDEAWTSGRTFEERALVALDALASYGRGVSNDERLDVADVLEETLREQSIPDPGRAFATTFALACFEGYGASARLHVHARNLHPATSDAIEDALSLGSSRHIHDLLLSLLCEDGSPGLLERALRIARRRGRVPPILVLDLLSHPEPRIAIAAAQAAVVSEPHLAAFRLEDALYGPDDVAVHAAETIARLHVSARGWAARLHALASGDPVAPSTSHAVRLSVLQARGRDVEPLIELCARLPREASVDLLGWLGSPKALDHLRDALEDPSPEVRERAAWSLSRITGAGRDMLGNIEVDENGDPLHDPDSEPLLEPADRTRRHPPLDASFWAEPILRARAADAPRLRFGQPLDAAAVLDELAHPAAHQGVRRVLVTELAILSPGPPAPLPMPDIRALGPDRRGLYPDPPLDVDGWIARQEQQIAAAREAAGLPPSPGGRR